jgi:hypothetical protein
MYLVENMIFDQRSSIELINFKFTSNYNLFNNYFDQNIRYAIGTSNSIYIKGSGIIFYDENSDINIDIPELALKHKLLEKTDNKSVLLNAFLNFLWLIKDHSIAIQAYVGKLLPTTFCVMSAFNPKVTTSSGEVFPIPFTVQELEQAHILWQKYRATIHVPLNNDRVGTTIMTIPEMGFIRTRLKTFHVDFDYSKTNCLERAFHFIEIARSQDYLIYKISFYVSAFECLFTTDSNSVTLKLRYRVAIYLGTSYSDRLEIDKLIKEAYDIRSTFIHGQVFGKEKIKKDLTSNQLIKLSRKLDELLRMSIKKIIMHDLGDFIIKDSSAREAIFHKWVYEKEIGIQESKENV